MTEFSDEDTEDDGIQSEKAPAEEEEFVRLDPMSRVHYYDVRELDRDDLKRLEQICGLRSGLDLGARIEIERERIRRAERPDPLVMFTHAEIVQIGQALVEVESMGGLPESAAVTSEEVQTLGDKLLDITLDDKEIPESAQAGKMIDELYQAVIDTTEGNSLASTR